MMGNSEDPELFFKNERVIIKREQLIRLSTAHRHPAGNFGNHGSLHLFFVIITQQAKLFDDSFVVNGR